MLKIESSQLKSALFRPYGFKHAAVSLIAATVMHPNTRFIFQNVPLIDDVFVLTKILKHLGATVNLQQHQLIIDTKNLQSFQIPRNLCVEVHGIVYLLPSLLSRFGKAELYEGGGCQIGNSDEAFKRPMQHMFSVLNKFGYTCQQQAGYIAATRTHEPPYCNIDIMDYSIDPLILTGSHISGATKTAILAAMKPNRLKQTEIHHPYRKPDVTELIFLLQLLHYDIQFDNTQLKIARTAATEEVEEVELTLISDLSEIITYICIAIFHDIEVTIEEINIDLVRAGLQEEFRLMQQMGIELIFKKNAIIVPRVKQILPLDIAVTSIGIYSDHQPFFAILLSLAKGQSNIVEQVWKNRFSYATELQKLGFNIKLCDDMIQIQPHTHLRGNQSLIAKDLRAAAVLIIAALKSCGTSYLTGWQHLSRGYENFLQNLLICGARISIINE